MQLRNHPVGMFHITRVRTTLQVQHDGPVFAKTLQAPWISFDPQPATPQARRPTAACKPQLRGCYVITGRQGSEATFRPLNRRTYLQKPDTGG
jgi:hypothetical protein